MKTQAPQLHLEYRFYKQLGVHGEWEELPSELALWVK